MPGRPRSITVTYSVDTTTEADATVDNTATADLRRRRRPDQRDSTPSTIVEDVTLVTTKTFADDAVDAGTGGHTFTIDVTNTGVSRPTTSPSPTGRPPPHRRLA